MWLTQSVKGHISSPRTQPSWHSEQLSSTLHTSGNYMDYQSKSCPTEGLSSSQSSLASCTDFSASSWQPQRPITHRQMARPNVSTKNWGNTFPYSSTKDRTIGTTSCRWLSFNTTIMYTRPPNRPHSC